MTPLLLYILKANIALAVFCCFYVLFLRRDTFYTWNRSYFILAAFFSALLPAIDFSAMFPEGKSLIYVTRIIPDDINVSGATSTLTVYDFIKWSIVAGASVLLIRLCVQLVSLFLLYLRSVKSNLYNRNIVLIGDKVNPFSFFNWVFVNPDMYSPEDLEEIIAHEHVHVSQRHTIDVLLYELVAVLCWYNPFAWLMKLEMKQNLEFMADKRILNAGYDKRRYQYNLLKVSQIPVYSGIVNNFNFNHLKNRIMMMNKKQSKYANLLKFALVIPLLGGMVLTVNAKNNAELKENSSGVEVIAEADNVMAFDKMTHEFGTIKEDDGPVTVVFTFVNNGKTPIVISNVRPSCGCTTPEWTKEPVAPKKKGYIKATFDPKGRIGPFDKTITVDVNIDPSQVVLRFKGEVVK